MNIMYVYKQIIYIYIYILVFSICDIRKLKNRY